MILQQIRSIAPPLIVAALVQATVFWWLGWQETALVRASCFWVLMATTGLIATRSLNNYALNHPTIERRLTRRIAIIGSDAHAFRVAERLASESQKGIVVLGVFGDAPALAGQMPVRGSLADLISLSRDSHLNGIIIALPPGAEREGEITRLSSRLRGVLADVFVMPYLIHDPDVLLPVQTLGSMFFMVLQRRPLDVGQRLRKRLFDILICTLALIPFLVLFVIVAAAIKLESPGPVLFRQPRYGFNNLQFTVFKFRSMYASASDILSVRQTSRDDPRVTRIGKWLRKLSIDEVPQILNVLRGEMSLVGPRPHAPQTRVDGELLNEVISEYVLRYHVKPGITGWAQINGARGELVTGDDLRRRVALDLEYIQRWSIGFDLKIIMLTAIREIMSKHAY
jgi:Undecaprenyl-phosphate glucose phosphotransferase